MPDNADHSPAGARLEGEPDGSTEERSRDYQRLRRELLGAEPDDREHAEQPEPEAQVHPLVGGHPDVRHAAAVDQFLQYKGAEPAWLRQRRLFIRAFVECHALGFINEPG